MIGEKVVLRVRMNKSDVHYFGETVTTATMLRYFGDVNTELAIRQDGDEGLFVAYSSIDFLKPVYIGDYIEYHGWIECKGNTSRRIRLKAYKTIQQNRVLNPPELVGKAVGTIVIRRLVKENSKTLF